jgi:transcriptional regulator with XRE-family HTH domain
MLESAAANDIFQEEANPMREKNGSADSLGKVLRQAIKKNGQTQASLANKMGVSQSAVSKWLKEAEPIPYERVKEIVGILGLNDNEIHEINAWIITEHDKNNRTSVEFNRNILNLCRSTMEQIGPDSILLQVLIYWSQFNEEQKVKVLKFILPKGNEDKK